MDDATIKLAEAANSVSRSLTELSRIEAATTDPAKVDRLPNAQAYHIKGTASVDWTGPIGPLVKQIAAASNYRLRIVGNPPAVPIIISITTKNAQLGEILRDADFQASRKADIVVYPKTKTSDAIIELRYSHA